MADEGVGSIRENCWKRIGVFSRENAVCSELTRVIHCRNCEVYTRSGRELLEREIPESYRNAWAEAMAEKKREDAPGTFSVVIFRIGREWLALPTRLLAEIIHPEPFHTLPHRKSRVLLGIVHVHGEIQLCVSFHRLLDIGEPAVEFEPGYERMIVLDRNGEQWVFPVNEILGIFRVDPGRFRNVPVTVAMAQSAFTEGIFRWKDKNVALLDSELLFFHLSRNVQ
jgi:chemotaxis-related protein WspD